MNVFAGELCMIFFNTHEIFQTIHNKLYLFLFNCKLSKAQKYFRNDGNELWSLCVWILNFLNILFFIGCYADKIAYKDFLAV